MKNCECKGRKECPVCFAVMDEFMNSLSPELLAVASLYPEGCFDRVILMGDGPKVRGLLIADLESEGKPTGI